MAFECKGKKLFSLCECDVLNPDSLATPPKDIDVAYYLIHSMSDSQQFKSLEERCALNFSKYIDATSAEQIIYLGGISNAKVLSKHLESRHLVEAALGTSKVPVTVLRAAIIIGSGSASFEMIRDLVEKLPVMITPKWLNTRCQPIAVRDALAYLMGVMLSECIRTDL